MTKQKEIEIKDAIKRPKKMTEVITPFFRFEKVGDKLEGILTNIEKMDKFNIYTLTQYSGDVTRFHGSTQLDNLLNTIETPSYVEIVFTETMPSKQGSDLKIFKVFKGEN